MYLSLAGFVVQIGLTSRIHRSLGLAVAPRLAWFGVLALLLTPPLRLAVTAGAFWREGARRYAAAAAVVFLALVLAAIRAARP